MNTRTKKRKHQSLEPPDCKYGASCYQKSLDHRKRFKHPTANKKKRLSVVCDNEKDTKKALPQPKAVQVKKNKESVEDRLKTMPEDFFKLWDFCKSVSKSEPGEAFNDLGLHLVGPYALLGKKLNDEITTDLDLHWRYYYDPPEFQTVIAVDGTDLYHIGYFRDNPSDMPAIVASNSAALGPKLVLMGDNIFAAINTVLTRVLQKLKNESRKGKFLKIQSNLQKFAKARNYSLETETPKTKARKEKVVTKSFHSLGIVVPYDKKSELGYRSLPYSDAQLKAVLKRIASCETERKRLNEEEALEEIVTLVHLANDECDYGMGLELGIDLFCFGDPTFHNYVSMLLPLAYDLLGRPKYGEIIKAHLKNRKNDNLNTVSS